MLNLNKLYMKKPKISIVIPIYNDEKYIEERLNSVIKQSFKDFECICVDDCSTDKTDKIINTFTQKDKRFKNIRHETNLGVSYSRYTGLLQDLTKVGDIIRSSTYDAFFPLIATAVIITLMIALVSNIKIKGIHKKPTIINM